MTRPKTKKPPRTTYTPADARRWHRMYQTHAMRAVSARYGVPTMTILNWFRRLGLETRGPGTASPAERQRQRARRRAKLLAQARALG